jgi:hypothetical protein
MDEVELDRLRSWAAHFVARKERASERLSKIEGEYWYVALVGLDLPVQTYNLVGEFAEIRAVVEPPDVVELNRIAKRLQQ